MLYHSPLYEGFILRVTFPKYSEGVRREKIEILQQENDL